MNDAIIGVRVQIKPRSHYHGRFAGELGEIVRIYEGNVAVRIDGISNIRSKYGVFWFSEKEIEIIESEEISMNGDYVTAKVAFLNGTNTNKTLRQRHPAGRSRGCPDRAPRVGGCPCGFDGR